MPAVDLVTDNLVCALFVCFRFLRISAGSRCAFGGPFGFFGEGVRVVGAECFVGRSLLAVQTKLDNRLLLFIAANVRPEISLGDVLDSVAKVLVCGHGLGLDSGNP